MKSYAMAARANPASQQYRQQYMLVRQTMELHRRLEIEKDPQRWELYARALPTF